MCRYINNILTKAEIPNKYNIRNSFELKSIIDKIKLRSDDIMVSFDIVSMYERIALKLVYESLVITQKMEYN